MTIDILAAFLAALLGYILALRLFPKIGLVDFPGRYGLSRPPIPYPAGIIAVVVFLGWFVLRIDIQMQQVGVLIGIVLLALTTCIDDRTPIASWLRLVIQSLVSIIIFAAGSRIYSLTSPFGGLLKLDTVVIDAGLLGSLPIWSGIFTVAWLLLTINALNWFDGIPGQVSLISFIGFLMLGLLAYARNGEPETAVIAFVLAAIAGAGLLFDVPPAKMLLGDTGSMFFGLMIGLLGIYSGGKVATVFLALGIPLIDAAFVILRRIRRGASPMKGGRDHLHHLLLDRGWSPRMIIALTAGIGTCFGGAALFLNTAQKGIAFVLLFSVILGLTIYASRKMPPNDLRPSAHS